MLPFSFEWIWDASHMVFHGGLWYALTIIGLGMTYCIIKAVLDARKGNGDHNIRGALFCFDIALLKLF
jgi:hypothetical protein